MDADLTEDHAPPGAPDVFSPAWYLKAYPDVAAAGVDPLHHYLGTGWEENRRPGPAFDLLASSLFDPDWYSRRHPDVAGRPLDLLRHFLFAGWREGRWPNPAFDPDWYLHANPVVGNNRWHPLLHYALVGEREGLRPVPWFDPAWYQAAAGVRGTWALSHYLRHGDRAAPCRALFALPHLGVRGVDAVRAWMREHPGAEADPKPHDMALVRQSGLFDEAFYLRFYPDVLDSGEDALTHYCGPGWQEMRRPNFYFDPAVYLRENPMAADDGIGPLLHYITQGAAYGARPGPHFDPIWYAKAYGPFTETDGLPLAHFLRQRDQRRFAPTAALYPVPGLAATATSTAPDIFEAFVTQPPAPGRPSAAMQLIEESGLFDLNHYGTEDANILQAGVDPLRHFTEQGWMEIRTPNPYFNPRWYLHTNPSVAALKINPVLHYIRDGEAAGRRPILFFDPDWYRQRYGLPPGVSPLRHYLDHRRGQEHSPLPEFDVAFFKQRHANRIRPGRDLFMVFLALSAREDLDPGPEFDSQAYRRRHMGRRSRYFAQGEEDTIPLLHALRARYR